MQWRLTADSVTQHKNIYFNSITKLHQGYPTGSREIKKCLMRLG